MKVSQHTTENDSGILIVEDDPAARETLCHVVNSIANVKVLAAVDSVSCALQHLQRNEPDLVLCDLGLPDGDGVEVIQQCAARDIPAMVISIFDDESTVFRAIEAGATGYLLKDQPVDVVRRAVVDLLAGGSPITPSIARFLLQQLSGSGSAQNGRQGVSNAASNGTGGGTNVESDLLSNREKEVLSLLAQGYKSKEVAGKLTLSHHTIASHQRNVYAKLCVRNKSEAVAVAMKKGLIDP